MKKTLAIMLWVGVVVLYFTGIGCSNYSRQTSLILAKVEHAILPHTYFNEVVILTFHDISSTDKTRYAISPQMFESEIQDLVNNGYNIISLAQAVNFSQGKETIPRNAVVITTDDGYAGMYEYVYPVLKKYKIPATFFLVAGVMGKNQNTLTWLQIREMEGSGLVTFGGHTYNSHNEVLVSPSILEPASIGHIYDPKTGHTETLAEYYNRMFSDSQRAQELFRKELGHTSAFFAYPYGAFTPEFDKSLKASGYKCFFTEIPGILHRKHNHNHFYRLDIGIPTLTPTQMINEIHQWSELTTPANNIPPRYVLRWKQ